MGTKKGETVRKLVDNSVQLYTSPIVIAEIYSKSMRTDGNVKERTDFIIDRCALIPIDDVIAVEAAKIHAENREKFKDFGLADAFIMASARSKGLGVMTGDMHFEEFEDAVMLL